MLYNLLSVQFKRGLLKFIISLRFGPWYTYIENFEIFIKSISLANVRVLAQINTNLKNTGASFSAIIIKTGEIEDSKSYQMSSISLVIFK